MNKSFLCVTSCLRTRNPRAGGCDLFCISSNGWWLQGSRHSLCKALHQVSKIWKLLEVFLMDSTQVCTAEREGGERERVREVWGTEGERNGANANTKGNELPAILQIHTHSGTGTHTLHVVMQCKKWYPIITYTWWHGKYCHNNKTGGKEAKIPVTCITCSGTCTHRHTQTHTHTHTHAHTQSFSFFSSVFTSSYL